MAVRLPRVDARDPVDEIVSTLEEHGGVIVEELLDRELLARFNAELDPFVEAAQPDRSFINPALDAFFGKHTRHLNGIAAKSRTFATEVLCHPLMLGVCDAILGPSCARYQLNIASVLDRGPGADAQYLHRDELVWVHMPRPHPELQVASVIALENFDEANGATRLVPGSHRWPYEREVRESDVVSAEMPAGSAVVYLGSTIHGGGANRTQDRTRRGMHMSYVLGWLRTEANNYLETPLEIARDLPRKTLELLGYSAHDAIAAGGGYLGAVDLLDPVELLEKGEL